jgi:probable HAF family extracellular repeat protein
MPARCALVLAAAAFACLAGLAIAVTIQYRFSSAGEPPGASQTFPLADNLRQIAGYYIIASGVSAGYMETLPSHPKSGTPSFFTFAPPGGAESYAAGINAHGVVVGGFCPPPGCNPTAADSGFTYSNGIYTTVNYPQTGATTAAYGINDLGEIVGGFCSGPFACPVGAFARTAHGFLDNQGIFTQLDYPGSQDTQADAINGAGVIVGAYDISNTGPHGFIYQNGVFKNIDVPGSGFTYPGAINNKGVAAGYYQNPVNFTIHGFLYHDGTFTTVDYPNTPVSGLTGINDDGVIVGSWAPPIGVDKPFKGVPVR